MACLELFHISGSLAGGQKAERFCRYFVRCERMPSALMEIPSEMLSR